LDFFSFLFQSNICGQIHGNKQHKKIITVLLCVYKIKLQRVSCSYTKHNSIRNQGDSHPNVD